MFERLFFVTYVSERKKEKILMLIYLEGESGGVEESMSKQRGQCWSYTVKIIFTMVTKNNLP